MAEDPLHEQKGLEGPRRRAKTATSAFGVSKREGHDSSAFYTAKMNQAFISSREVGDADSIPPHLSNTIHCHDSTDLHFIPNNCVDLVVTSPPYNATKEYDEDLTFDQYLNLLRGVFSECYRVLTPGGRMVVNVANLGRKPYLPLTSYINVMMIELGFLMRGEIIWDKSASAGSSCAWGSFQSASNPCLRDVHEYLLVFSKGDFKKSMVGPDKNVKQNTIDKDEFIQFSKSIWSFSTERASRVQHPAPFPIELPRRCIEFYSYEGDVVLDPFLGSGSTALAALLTNRTYIGVDISEEYCKTAQQRVADLLPSLKL
jgi:DNA modification methylase